MIHDQQHDVIVFLSDPRTFNADDRVEVIETHISMIFLVGTKAYKLKKAVKLPYVDFSTPALRLSACLKEFELNSQTAPGLYLGVSSVMRRANGGIGLSGDGTLLDAVVEMTRFSQELLFDRLAAAGELTDALMTSVAHTIIRFHETAQIASNLDGPRQMRAVLDVNRAGFATSTVFTQPEIDALSKRFSDALHHHGERLRQRAMNGRFRRCHGDLHLRNIVLLSGEPSLFDCIEFNDEIATVDVLYDLAFLLMDLWNQGHCHHANLVMNRYLDGTENEDGFVLLPFFLAVRAAVRAHVIATQAQTAAGDIQRLCREARSYFDLAGALLEVVPSQLIAIGGLSGSGKTTIAEALAPLIGAPPGARIIESDRIRKSLHGVNAETRLPAAAYQPDVSRRVYADMVLRTAGILSDGGSVVADAVYDDPAHRASIERVARERSVRFDGFWLRTEACVLRNRVLSRTKGASDATVEVLNMQEARASPQVDWRQIDASRSVKDNCADILQSGQTAESDR
jgi:aminoglycoside phosphotransferase family enzyme/predicted kinase